jgi:hypothetical protein
LIDSLQRTIPFIRDVPLDYFLVISSIILFLFLAVFITVFTLGYYDTLDTIYLSPSDQVVNEKYCELVPTTNTGTFYATKSGYGQNSEYCQYSNASFVSYIAGLSLSQEEYSDLLMDVYESLATIGRQALFQDLATNLVNWMAVSFYVPEQSSQRFYLIGDPTVVFTRRHHRGWIGSVNGTCNVSSITTYDRTTGTLLLNYDYNAFIQDPLCSSIISPELLGYVPVVD